MLLRRLGEGRSKEREGGASVMGFFVFCFLVVAVFVLGNWKKFGLVERTAVM